MLEWLPDTSEEMQPDDYYRAALEVTEEGYIGWTYVAPKHYKAQNLLTTISFELNDDLFTCRKNDEVLIKMRLYTHAADTLWSAIYRSTQ